MTGKDIDKKEFLTWLRMNHNYSETTNSSILSDSFLIFRENLGLTVEDLLEEKRNLQDFRGAVEKWLLDKGAAPNYRPQGYAWSLRLLMDYLRRDLSFVKTKDEEKDTPPIVKPDGKKSRKRASKVTLDLPTPALVSRYLSLWDNSLEYLHVEAALKLLFTDTFPTNTDFHQVLIKIVTLNDFYSTNVFNTYLVAQHYMTVDIDGRLGKADPGLVDDLAFVPALNKRFYSLATKYCSHHKPDDYPIYDSFVEKMLLQFRNQCHFVEFEARDLKEYPKFKQIVTRFRAFFGLEAFSFRDLDKYLWQAGKDSFPY